MTADCFRDMAFFVIVSNIFKTLKIFFLPNFEILIPVDGNCEITSGVAILAFQYD